MSERNPFVFDLWLTTEPEEECIHYGVECDNSECICTCGECPVEQ